MRDSSFIKITGTLLVLWCLSACTAKKGKLPQPAAEPQSINNGCDTAYVSYAKDVVPIIQSNCYSCHSTAVTSNAGGLDLENFTSLKSYLNNQFQGDGVYGSKFTHIINQSIGVIPMPPVSKLSPCDIGKISVWIRNGALQN